MRFIYLHGFASSPRSRKAQAFREALEARGISIEIPDLANGDFEHLTISAQLQLVEGLVGGQECRLAGSSMGGYLAALYAARHPESVNRVALLAPAFGFAARWRAMQGVEAMERWRSSGWLDVYHYGDKAQRRVHYGLFEDACGWPGFPDARQPALIFHGVKDDVVPVDLSREFARGHANAVLREMDSDHELLDVLEVVLTEAVPWLADGVSAQ